MDDDGKILSGFTDHTERQASLAVDKADMVPCFGNPNVSCKYGPVDVMIKGYDDKYRCGACNGIHVELVMKEAGSSSPNSTPQFVTPKIDKRATQERTARMDALYAKLEAKGHTGRPSESGVVPVAEGDHADMKSFRSHDEHGTRDPNIGEDERRRRILAKYGKRQ